jgi:hypothetical protein
MTGPQVTDSTPAQIETSTPLLMAYEVGRDLKRLHFAMNEFCLGVTDRTPIDDAFAQLQRNARKLVGPDSRESITARINDSLRELLGIRHSEWWCERYVECGEQLNSHPDDEGFSRETCDGVLRPFRRIAEALRAKIDKYLDVRGQNSLRLGWSVESACCACEVIAALPTTQLIEPPGDGFGRQLVVPSR